jgi:hypothetical protein
MASRELYSRLLRTIGGAFETFILSLHNASCLRSFPHDKPSLQVFSIDEFVSLCFSCKCTPNNLLIRDF